MLLLLLAPVLLVVLFVLVSSRPTRLNLTGAHVMITGGSSGIGLEVAKECAQKGSFISIIARNADKLESAKHEVEKCLKGGGERQCVMTLSLDISSSEKEIANGIKTMEDRLGPVDVLVNCAGVSYTDVFENTPGEKFDWLMRINYLGSVYCTKAVIPGMKQRKKGRVVFVSSQAGQLGVFGYTGYSASKFALRGLAEALQMEVKPYNIGVTVSFPPDTDTPGFQTDEETKPEETRLISETSGLFQPNTIARGIIHDMLRGEFFNTFGVEGFLLGYLTGGVIPCSSTISAFLQVLLLGPFRIAAFGFHKSFDSTILKCAQRRSQESSEKDK